MTPATRHPRKIISLIPDAAEKPLYRKTLQVPAVNVEENEAEYLIHMAAPGLRPEDFRVRFENHTLYISANCQEEQIACIRDRYEYSYQHWERIFEIPDDADIQFAHASCRFGELTIRIPKDTRPLPVEKLAVFVY